MPRVCTICTHPQRAAIDQALIAQEPYRHIASRTGTSTGALQRHKEHLPATLTNASQVEDVANADALLEQVRSLHQKTLGILAVAEGAGKLTTALQAIREARGCLELLAKLLGELRDGPTINILVTPQWRQVRAVLSQVLQPYPAIQRALAAALMRLEDSDRQHP